MTDPRPLAADDLARAVARESSGPCVVDLTRETWAREPSRVLDQLAGALMAPIAPHAAVYVDFRQSDGGAPDENGLALLVEFLRLLAVRPLELAEPEAPADEEFPGIIGRCPAMRAMFRTMARIATSDLVVHVCGETGTGKERVAAALHARSGRPGRFVPVNASSPSDELFESELFGHVRGAFTGAVADREGQVAAAERGTLFLDEVPDLSPRAQAKLLRFVETREYCRVGDPRPRKADVRIVTAANVPLESRLRPDLIFRLRDVVLALPPLRTRGEDVWRLAREFLRQYAPAGRPAPAVTPVRAADPGVLLLARQRPRAPTGDPPRGRPLRRRGHPSRAPVGGGGDAARAPLRSLKDTMLACERRHILEVLAEHGGNRARTAVALGLTRQGLVAKIARLGIG